MLQVKSQFVAEYIEENYIPLLSAAIIRVFGQGTRLEYRVLIDSTSGAGTTCLLPVRQRRTNVRFNNRRQSNNDLTPVELNPLYL